MIKALSGRSGLLVLFGVLSLAAVATGAWVSAASGVPASLWGRNLAAWAVGLLAAMGLAAMAKPGALPVLLLAAPAGLLVTLVSRGQQGVHRWIDLGPAHLNVAMLLLPAAIVAFAALAGERRWPRVALPAAMGLLVVQPDASQATALAGSAILIIAAVVRRPMVRIGLIAAVGLLAGLAWFRADPLQPVPEVEQIVSLAFSVSPLLAGMTLLLLLALAATPVIATRSDLSGQRLAGLSLGFYFLLWAAMPFFGAFPVPLVGIGMSPIIGAWLGVGLLAGQLTGELR